MERQSNGGFGRCTGMPGSPLQLSRCNKPLLSGCLFLMSLLPMSAAKRGKTEPRTDWRVVLSTPTLSGHGISARRELWAQASKTLLACAFLWRDLDQLDAKHKRKIQKSGDKRLFEDFILREIVPCHTLHVRILLKLRFCVTSLNSMRNTLLLRCLSLLTLGGTPCH